MTSVSFKEFSLSMAEDKEGAFIDKVEALCKNYSGNDYTFGYDVEPDGDESFPCISLWFNYFGIRLDEEDDESFIDQLEQICREFAGDNFYFRQNEGI